MKIQKIRIDELDFEYLKAVHETGLTIYMYPDSSYSSTYAIYGTNYGSIDNCFSVGGGDFKTVPPGIAHFLEHKLFESEDKDAFERYAKTGASANAFTSFDKTCYLFSCTENSRESLEILLDFVNSPYFTKETVEKEQGIIGQEIRMYDDSPDWRVFFGLLGQLYKNNPVKIDIAGTTESIATIDKDLLYDCYYDFYRPENMALAVAGNFNCDDVVELVNQYVKPSVRPNVVKRDVEEPRETVKESNEVKLPVAMPLFAIGYKEVPDSDGDFIKGQVMGEVIMEAIAGEASDLFCSLYDSGLINLSFSTEVFAGRGYLANMFEGESKDPEKVREMISAALIKAKDKGIRKEVFDRAKKVVYGRYVKGFSNLESIASSMVSMHFYHSDIYEAVDILKKLELPVVNERLRNQFKEQYRCISIVNEK